MRAECRLLGMAGAVGAAWRPGGSVKWTERWIARAQRKADERDELAISFGCGSCGVRLRSWSGPGDGAAVATGTTGHRAGHNRCDGPPYRLRPGP
jgi:hypothetical protein